MSTVNLFLAALKGVLRELPDGASGFRVEPGPSGYVTVQLMGPHGPLVACTVAQRVAPRNASRQLTIDDAIAARQDVRAAAAAPPAPAAPAADTPPEPAAASPATVADDRGADLGEDGREFPDGEPYAELRVVRSDWPHHRRALGDVVGGAHHGDWRPDGDHRTLVVSRSQLGKIIGALGVHSAILDVTRLGPMPRPPTSPASSAPQQLWVAASEWKGLSPEVRDELGEHVWDGWRREGDWYTDTPYADAAGYVYDKLCREGVAVHLEPPPAPPKKAPRAPKAAKPAKPAKAPKVSAAAVLHRDQPHAECDALAEQFEGGTSGLASVTNSGRAVHASRPGGIDEKGWREMVASCLTPGSYTVARVYRDGVCVWDSRDGGQP